LRKTFAQLIDFIVLICREIKYAANSTVCQQASVSVFPLDAVFLAPNAGIAAFATFSTSRINTRYGYYLFILAFSEASIRVASMQWESTPPQSPAQSSSLSWRLR
jgi:hypothetical protein